MSNIYLLYGEEKYDINQKIEKIKRSFANLEVGVNLFYINLDNNVNISKDGKIDILDLIKMKNAL